MFIQNLGQTPFACSTRYWIMTVWFPPISPLFVYFYTHVFPCSLCNSFMHVLGWADNMHFIFTQILFGPVTLCSVYMIFFLISYDTFITISAIWYVFHTIWLCRMKYPCIVFLRDNVLNCTFRRIGNGGCLSLDSTLDQIKFWMGEQFASRNNK